MNISNFNRALGQIPARAEEREDAKLYETFMDAGILTVLSSPGNQILSGRRGTGKTHALAFLAEARVKAGDIAIKLDLRTVGSQDGVFNIKGYVAEIRHLQAVAAEEEP